MFRKASVFFFFFLWPYKEDEDLPVLWDQPWISELQGIRVCYHSWYIFSLLKSRAYQNLFLSVLNITRTWSYHYKQEVLQFTYTLINLQIIKKSWPKCVAVNTRAKKTTISCFDCFIFNLLSISTLVVSHI